MLKQRRRRKHVNTLFGVRKAEEVVVALESVWLLSEVVFLLKRRRTILKMQCPPDLKSIEEEKTPYCMKPVSNQNV